MSIRYKAKTDFYIHRSVANSDILVSIGRNLEVHNGYIEINKTAAYIWDLMKDPCTVEELADQLVKKYVVDKEVAQNDVIEILSVMEDRNMVMICE